MTPIEADIEALTAPSIEVEKPKKAASKVPKVMLVWAKAPALSETKSAATAAATRKIFIGLVPISGADWRRCFDYINNGGW